ncbi:MAG: exodeoxyribonuclease V subunit gamma [Lachnospiraceae bacterium]|nr:exodeoxyribonuclease V subunit gamma [Lachnospiraceae bacterium]
MSLQFVVGPAGAGKSTYIYEWLKNEAKVNQSTNFLLIVPDQFTMQTQMDIVKKNNNGIMNIDVLCFSRLAYRIFEETGRAAYPVLDDTGKSLMLRTVAAKVSSTMPYLGKNLSKTGFIHEVKSSISEFMQYSISVSDLKRIAAEVDDGLMKHKLRDLSVIYEAFEDYKKDRFITNEETLDVLCDKLTQSVIIKKSVVIFDGFTGFTPIQERVIKRLMELSQKVIVTLTLPGKAEAENVLSEEKLFYLTSKTSDRLKNLAKQSNVSLDETIELKGENGRFSQKPSLAFLEKNLFGYPKKPFSGDNENVKIFACASVSSEVDAICNKIYDLLLTGQYKYRDIAIVTGNLESYASLFESRFKKLNIPCFIDRTNSIGLNPFIEFLKSSMQLLIQDFSYDSVMHLLRSGFTDFSNDETDRFDRYIKSLNIRGSKKYLNTFRRAQYDMRKGNFKDKALLEVTKRDESRAKLMAMLAPIMVECKTAGDYTKAMYDYLVKNLSFDRLDKMANAFEAENELSKAVEYRQIYRHVMDLLDTIVALVGDEEMSLKEYYKIFEAGIDEIKVGTIPKGVDRILVGDIERTRLNETKALFFAGVNDTNIPKGGDKGGILSSIDRENLRDLLDKKFAADGFILAPSPREQMYTQRLYLYMNMCKPTDRLFISYAGIAADGSSMRPSYLVDTVKRLYKDMKVENVEKEALADRIISIEDSYKYYADMLKDYASGNNEDDSQMALMKALYSLYQENGLNKDVQNIHEAAFYQYVGKPLSQEIARLLYSDILYGSVSRFEKYANCAYSHFLSYGIGLSEPVNYEFARVDMGNVCHEILDRFSDALKLKNYTLKDFPEKEGGEILSNVIEEVLSQDEFDILSEDKAGENVKNRIRNIMIKTVSMLKYQLSRGKFVPSFNEKRVTGQIDLINDAKAVFHGKIDRIDLCHEDDRVYVKIIDYKSSDKSLDVTKIYYGLEQQLISYMTQALKDVEKLHPQKDVIPSSIFYYTMKNPFVKLEEEAGPEKIEKMLKKTFVMKGMLLDDNDNFRLLDENAAGDEADILPIGFKKDGTLNSYSTDKVLGREEMQSMMDYVSRMTKRIGDNIVSGDIKISPIGEDEGSSCKYCPYRNVCRFDERIEGYKVRNINSVSTEEAREYVLGGASNERDYLFE